jgi:hypothetical protein
MTTTADWYPDPTGRHQLRFHNGSTWTEHVSTNGTTSSDLLEVGVAPDVLAAPQPKAAKARPSFKEAMAANKAKQAAKVEARHEARVEAAGDGALLVVTSHDPGRNAVVTLYPDRIERVKQAAFSSLSKANQDAEVIPTKSISSVQAKKDGLVFTKVTAYASGNTIVFRLSHAEAKSFKDALTKLVLEQSSSSGQTVVAPDPVEQLRKLAELRDLGVVSVEEFEAKKADLLARM